MALTFPANPVNGQLYDQYTYDSVSGSWRLYGTSLDIVNALATKANLSGGNTFSGNQTFSNYVLKPGQPSFHAYPPDTSWSNSTTNTDMTNFSVTRHNVGGHYNTSTGRFTAPVAGYYLFTVSIFMHTSYANNTNTYWGFYLNGAGVNVNNHGTSGSDGGQSISGIYYMAVGDYLSIRHNSQIQSWGGQFCSFNGQLLS